MEADESARHSRAAEGKRNRGEHLLQSGRRLCAEGMSVNSSHQIREKI